MTPLVAALFDLDGTLADTAPDLGATLKTMLQQRGRALPEDAQLRPLASNGARALLAFGFGLESREAVPEDLLAEYLAIYEARQHQLSRCFAGVPELLAALDRRRVPWGVVTSKPHQLSETLLETLQIYPACLVCPEQVENRKPHPEPVLRALEILDVEAKASVFAGDHHNDLVSGRQAGVAVAACTWGYGALDDLTEADCDFRAASPSELHQWLLRRAPEESALKQAKGQR